MDSAVEYSARLTCRRPRVEHMERWYRSIGRTTFNSCACLSGFGPDHEVTCTIANHGAVGGLEVEILLRADITPDHIFLYELDCVYAEHGIHLVRWDMTKANPNSFTELYRSSTMLRRFLGGEVPFSNGDQVYAKVVGTVITCRYKRVNERDVFQCIHL